MKKLGTIFLALFSCIKVSANDFTIQKGQNRFSITIPDEEDVKPNSSPDCWKHVPIT